jgi:hypothetical protein
VGSRCFTGLNDAHVRFLMGMLYHLGGMIVDLTDSVLSFELELHQRVFAPLEVDCAEVQESMRSESRGTAPAYVLSDEVDASQHRRRRDGLATA